MTSDLRDWVPRVLRGCSYVHEPDLDLHGGLLQVLHVKRVFFFFKSKCYSKREGDLHSYEARGRETYRTGRHILVVEHFRYILFTIVIHFM